MQREQSEQREQAEQAETWFRIANPEKLRTPALCFYPARIEQNIAEALRVAGTADRLRPHVKTYKCPNVVQMLLRAGVTRFKCATLTEAEMLAQAGAPDVLLAYPMIGPNAEAFVALTLRYPNVRFQTIADSVEGLEALETAVAGMSEPGGGAVPAQSGAKALEVLVDINAGMNRTGIAPGEPALRLYRRIAESARLEPAGVHAYDGHIRDHELSARCAAAAETSAAAEQLRSAAVAEGIAVPRVVMGGTPTFPCHAERPDVELSPGTCFLHDGGYSEQHPDLRFLPAALIVGRVISRPADGLFAIDIGSKAIATDRAGARGAILNLPGAEPIGQSEEHWVFRGADVARLPAIGELVYVLPRHICPSVEHYDYATVIDAAGTATERWPIAARGRGLSFM